MPSPATREQVLDAILDGTVVEHLNSNVELKSDWSQDCGKKLSGLANKRLEIPAWLIVGINDKGQRIGRTAEWVKTTEATLSQHLNQYLDPAQAVARIEKVTHPSGWLILLEVCCPGAITNWNHKAYKMAGSTVAEMAPHETMELTIALPGLTDYSKQPWNETPDPALVCEFAKTLAKSKNADEQLRQLASDEPLKVPGELRIDSRRAAYVLFGNTRFRSVACDSEGNVKKNSVETGLVRLLLPEYQATLQGLGKDLSKSTSDEPFLAPRALSEALANAVAHAAYFEKDGEIVVELHPDRLVVSNLCIPAAAFFANKWFSNARNTVNGLLMETLRIAGASDELGRGKNIIFRESILLGKRQPIVEVERQGRLHRWRLTLFGGPPDSKQQRLYDRLREIYDNDREALLAQALVLWSSEPLGRIRDYMDQASQRDLERVLSNPSCPIFTQDNSIYLARWVRVLLEKGQDSNALSEAEESNLLQMCYRLARQFNNRRITSDQLKKWAGLGPSPAERTQASQILGRWKKQGVLTKIRRGEYEFVTRREWDQRALEEGRLQNLLSILTGSSTTIGDKD